MTDKGPVIKCCVCGRQKTGNGWEFRGESFGKDTVFSHGFCTSCYETELMKVKLRVIAGAEAVYK